MGNCQWCQRAIRLRCLGRPSQRFGAAGKNSWLSAPDCIFRLQYAERRYMMLRRQALGLLTASPLPITVRLANRNPVMRVGAFSEVQAKKAALGNGYSSRVRSGQTSPRKERHSLSRNGYRGSPHPLPLTPAGGPRDICTTSHWRPRPAQAKGGDRVWPTSQAVQVNTIEQPVGQTASQPCVVTSAGGRAISFGDTP